MAESDQNTRKEQEQCRECFGQTIVFKGHGLDVQYRICPYWKESGHKSESEIEMEIARVRRQTRPSGRFA